MVLEVSVLIVVLVLAVIPASHAQTAPHAHAALHGGQVREAAGHHVEFKVDSSGNISIWLRDAQEHPLSPPPGATITLIEAPGCEHTLPLRADAAGQRLEASFDPARYPAFEALVTLRVAGKWRHVRFRYP